MSRFYPLVIIFLFFFSLLLPHILYLIGWLWSKIFHHTIRYAPFLKMSFALLVLLLSMILYGFYVGRWKREVKRTDITFADLPRAFDNYRIVHISDLHLYSFGGNSKELQKTTDIINALRPDLICFTGDLVTFHPEEVNYYTSFLSQLSARDGIVSVLGNHDCFPYTFRLTQDERNKLIVQLTELEEGCGWTVLNNSHIVLSRDTSHITIVGVMNQSCLRTSVSPVQLGDLKKALTGTTGFKILLSHDPTHWESEVVDATDIQLTLSGHTHNAQFSLGGWSPVKWFYEHTAGLYEHGKQLLYVNTGIGCTAPFRIGVPQEITLITLHTPSQP